MLVLDRDSYFLGTFRLSHSYGASVCHTLSASFTQSPSEELLSHGVTLSELQASSQGVFTALVQVLSANVHSRVGNIPRTSTAASEDLGFFGLGGGRW